MNQLIHMLEDKIGRKAEVVHQPLNSADMLANWADTSKARRMLGWRPQVSLEQGVVNLVAWYQAERDWASQIQTD